MSYYFRWTPVPGVVERFGGPQTRINWTPQPENLPQVEEPLIPTKIKLQSDQPMLKCKWPPTPTQGKRARKPDVPDVNVAGIFILFKFSLINNENNNNHL